MTKMVEVTQEDANNYSRILTALGMEEEGDPVAAVERLASKGDEGPVWAPADSVKMLLERAASMLTGYGELIRRDGASHVEEHHYLPEVEHVAAELRALMDATPRTCGQLGMAVVDAIADDGLRNAAGGIYATRVQEFATEVQRAFAQQNGLLVPGLTICREDGRCQYAIDHGAEGLGHCPRGKCAMPDHGGPVAQRGRSETTMIELMEETANMLRGVCMDPRVPQDTKEALWSRVRKLDAATEATLDDEAGESDLHDMVRWAYSKLHHANYSKQEDALMLDRMKLLLEHGA